MTTIDLIRYLVKNHTLLLGTISIVLLISGIIETISLLFIAPIMDIITSSSKENYSDISNAMLNNFEALGLSTSLWFLFFSYIIIIGFNALFMTVSYYFVQKVKFSFCAQLISETITDIFNAKWLFFTNVQQGKLVNTLTRELQIVGDTLAGLGRLSSTLLQTLVFIIVPFYVSWKVMSLTMVIVTIIYLPFMFLSKINEHLGAMSTVASNNFLISLQESLGTVKVILGFGAQEKNKELIKKKYSKAVIASIKINVFSNGLQNTMVILTAVGLTSVYFVSQSIGILFSEIAIIFVSFIRVASKFNQIITEKALLDRSLPSLGQVEEIRALAVELRQTSGNIPFTKFKKNIQIRNLTFAYSERKPVLENITMNIPKGCMIAIVGESGAGKSTLIDLIMGFNDPISGKITLDDIPLCKYNINSYRSRIGYVPQESILFNMTIAENIRWANGQASDKEIKQACVNANVNNFVELFPDQYDTLVGDRGVRLSGGQLQRVALARAIIRKPDILILDEATSSLDTKSERYIQDAIGRIAQETTIIVIAHRLSTVLKADQIYVLEKGKIKENGDYNTLMTNQGLFSKMVKVQEFRADIV